MPTALKRKSISVDEEPKAKVAKVVKGAKTKVSYEVL